MKKYSLDLLRVPISWVVFALIITLQITTSLSSSALTERDRIIILGNDDMIAENGIIGGSGTNTDPYIMDGYTISIPNLNAVVIQNTDASVIIQNMYLHSSNSGISITNSSNIIIQNCTITNNSFGIYLRDTTDCIIHYNEIHQNYYGIFPWNCSGIGIEDNNMTANQYDVYVPQEDKQPWERTWVGTMLAALVFIIITAILLVLMWFRRKTYRYE